VQPSTFAALQGEVEIGGWNFGTAAAL